MILNIADKKLAELAAETICRHVEEGGWLGSNWPQYTCGWLDPHILDAALDAAESLYWDRHGVDMACASQNNFREHCMALDEASGD